MRDEQSSLSAGTGTRGVWRAEPARIAVAEDDGDMRSLVADALRLDGHRVVELSSGAELLIRVARQYRQLDPADPLDLIVSDVRMPVVTGLEILRGLRDAHCVTPVVLMTAFGDPATRREAESLGAVLLDKPLRLAELRQEVRKLLGDG
jgi:two-component system response regulator (stage 0 sporulation protein F)